VPVRCTGKIQILKRFSKPFMLTLLFSASLMVAKLIYIAIWKLLDAKSTILTPNSLQPYNTTHLKKTMVTRYLRLVLPPILERTSVLYDTFHVPIHGLLLFTGKAPPPFLLPGSAIFPMSLAPASPLLFCQTYFFLVCWPEIVCALTSTHVVLYHLKPMC
jgi:hypothetical protein